MTIAAGPAMALTASPAASDDEGPVAYTSWIHGATNTCQLAKVDLDNGHVKAIGPTFDFDAQGCPWDLAVRPDHEGDGEIEKIYAVVDPCEPGIPCETPAALSKQSVTDTAHAADAPVGISTAANSFLVTIDPETGKRTTIGALGFGSDLGSLTFDDDGHLWFYALSGDPACTSGQCLYRLDPDTGVPTLIADPTFAFIVFAGSTASCDHVFANAESRTAAGLYKVNTNSGGLIPRSETYPPNVSMNAIGRDASGQLWGLGFYPVPGPAMFADVVYKIDAESGKARQVVGNVDIDHPTDLLQGLEIVPLSCDQPETTTTTGPPVVVAAEPTFTG